MAERLIVLLTLARSFVRDQMKHLNNSSKAPKLSINVAASTVDINEWHTHRCKVLNASVNHMRGVVHTNSYYPNNEDQTS